VTSVVDPPLPAGYLARSACQQRKCSKRCSVCCFTRYSTRADRRRVNCAGTCAAPLLQRATGASAVSRGSDASVCEGIPKYCSFVRTECRHFQELHPVQPFVSSLNVVMIHGHTYKASNFCFVFYCTTLQSFESFLCATNFSDVARGRIFVFLCRWGGRDARSPSPHSSHRDAPVKFFATRRVGPRMQPSPLVTFTIDFAFLSRQSDRCVDRASLG
jgi:hypothetical protein